MFKYRLSKLFTVLSLLILMGCLPLELTNQEWSQMSSTERALAYDHARFLSREHHTIDEWRSWSQKKKTTNIKPI